MKYTRTHEWVEPEDEETLIVGVSQRAQQAFGGIVFVGLPEEGEEFEQDDPLGIIESIDGAVAHIRSPVTGEVIAVNDALEESPDLINRSPEGDGWFVKMRMESPRELDALMTPKEYEEYEEDVIEERDEFEDEENEYF